MKRKEFGSIRHIFKKEGLPDRIIDNLEKIVAQLYNKKTGRIEFDDEERVNLLIKAALSESPDILRDILRATDLLDKDLFKPLYPTLQQMAPLLEEIERFMVELAKEDEEKADDFLITERFPKERSAYGVILYRNYLNFITPSLIEEVEKRLAKIIEVSSSLEEVKLAKAALDSFSFMPREANPLMMYLFIKGLVVNMGLPEEIRRLTPSQKEADLAIKGLEDSLYAALAMGEEELLKEAK